MKVSGQRHTSVSSHQGQEPVVPTEQDSNTTPKIPLSVLEVLSHTLNQTLNSEEKVSSLSKTYAYICKIFSYSYKVLKTSSFCAKSLHTMGLNKRVAEKHTTTNFVFIKYVAQLNFMIKCMMGTKQKTNFFTDLMHKVMHTLNMLSFH